MIIADELQKLQDLHRSGALNDEEFARAKAAILNSTSTSQTPPPFPNAKSPEAIETETRQWGMFIHLSQLAGFVVPLGGIVLPIVLWQIKKKELPGVDVHGKIVVNWIISEVIYILLCIPLMFVLVGFLFFGIVVLLGIIFPIVGGLKANNGEVWQYPMSIQFIK